jgi:N-acetylglucosaminyldiphosphoundecaprenol N-acetyl-beta-D-mannosaminyltransferase
MFFVAVDAAHLAGNGPDHESAYAHQDRAGSQAGVNRQTIRSVHADPAEALSTTIRAEFDAGCGRGTDLNALMSDVCEICGIAVSRGPLGSHVRDVVGRAHQGNGAWLLTLNTEMLARGVRDPAYWSLVKKADIVTADGMPLVWASRIKHGQAAVDGRTTGVDLVDAILRRETVPRFAVIGGKDPLKTIERYGPQALDACSYVFDGKVDLSDNQLSFFCNELLRHEARVVFIALGVPKQDLLAFELRQRLPQLVMTGIGGTFEILGPQGSRAPVWMQRTGLEWLFRLVSEPRRLWRRYLINYPRGMWWLVKDCLVAPK